MRILISAKKKPFRLIIPIIGFLSFIWFLVRVIPKPSRATYPCMKVAYPLAAGFVIWLTSLFSSVFLFRRAKTLLSRKKYPLATLLILIALMLFYVNFQATNKETVASVLNSRFEPQSINQPIGIAKGINPGRVVWIHDPDATSWEGRGYWWSNDYNNQYDIDKMVSISLCSLTEADTDSEAWSALFRYFNTRHDKGNVGYQTGEKIAIKLNFNTCSGSGHTNYGNMTYASPHVVLAIARQLVYEAGVAQDDISFYDVTRYIASPVYTLCLKEFPDIHFVDWGGGDGIEKYQRDVNSRINWSEDFTISEPGGGNPAYLPTVVTGADYIINIANLKGHEVAGITLCSKNHLGSICADSYGEPTFLAPKGAGLHPYIATRSYYFDAEWDFKPRLAGTYNPLVDLIGHKDLGQKTLLFMVDALYAAKHQGTILDNTNKWQSAPFNNDWTSSIFMSQDPIAIESVCLDFMNAENNPYLTAVTDNYMHEAALANDPPSGTIYNPNNSEQGLQSLGVHEHWNNSQDKQYSRNLATDSGIELISLKGLINHPPTSILLSNQSISENNAIGDLIGRFAVMDIDTGDVHTYSLVSGEGDYDNTGFTITGDSLLADQTFDFEYKNSYTFRVKVTDNAADPLSYEEIFTITINDVDETAGMSELKPTQIAIFPNPLKNSATIVCPNPEETNYTLDIIDLTGKVVFSRKNIKTKTFIIQQQNLLPGYYIIELRGNSEYQGKILVE